tara:strand:- start:797 stop:997 length:201 start_codon:yes stop_codon:yes gene_type:complete
MSKAKETNNKNKNIDKYKAVNPKSFSEWYTTTAPKYFELSKGESVKLNLNDPTVIDWLNNKIIEKE